MLKEELKGRRLFSSRLFGPLCLISYGVLIIGGNLLDEVCALGIFVQGTGNEITTSFQRNIQLSPRRQPLMPTADTSWWPPGSTLALEVSKKCAEMGEETKLARKYFLLSQDSIPNSMVRVSLLSFKTLLG